MDNLCHSLAGAALAKMGLERRTPFAMPTLVVAANLPDIDVLAHLRDPLFALTFRRGWTHGVLAMALLPLLLAGLVLAWDRLVRLRRRPHAPPAPFRELLLLSLVGVLSHPPLDLLNTYGVRLLMPFSGRWFYADTLFIIDAWLSGFLAVAWLLGVAGSWRERAGRGGMGAARLARVAGGLALVYIGGMWALGRATAAAAAREAAALGMRPTRVMAAPVPLDPLRRAVLFDLNESYRWASADWRRPAPRLVPAAESITKNFDRPEVAAALEQPDARAFLGWSRFPAAAVIPSGVRLYDLRYADAETDSWASVVIPDRSSPAGSSVGYATAAGSATSLPARSPARLPALEKRR